MKVKSQMPLIRSLSMFPNSLWRAAVALIGCGVATWAQAALPIQHWTQPSGARVYLVESHAIPMVDVQIDLDAGSRRDPSAQAGLASVMAGQISSGMRADPAGKPKGR